MGNHTGPTSPVSRYSHLHNETDHLSQQISTLKYPTSNKLAAISVHFFNHKVQFSLYVYNSYLLR